MAETCLHGQGLAAFDVVNACSSVPYTFHGEMSGTITYTSTAETWGLRQKGSETYVLPDDCLAFFQASCSELATTKSAEYEIVDGKCALTLEADHQWTGSSDYVVSDSNITYKFSPLAVPFCVNGDAMGQTWEAGFTLLFKKR